MPIINTIPLSALLSEVQETLETDFGGAVYWVSCRIMNVKKYEQNRRCYLTLEEVHNGVKKAEARAIFWSNTYAEIEKFERATQQPFTNGLELICCVTVRFHVVYGLNLDVLRLDIAHTIGSLALEREAILQKLITNFPNNIKAIDGVYYTQNQQLALPPIIKRIALLTAANSDGQRDFIKELTDNKFEYQFIVDEYTTTIQGTQATQNLVEQLELINSSAINYDVVAIVRGGGALGDFQPFDTYELASAVANFPIPIFTGIGHDRNQSITDLMAREFKTPTKVASQIVAHNFEFEQAIIQVYEQIQQTMQLQITAAKEALHAAKRIIQLADPKHILKRGFAIVRHNEKIVTQSNQIALNDKLSIQLNNTLIQTEVLDIKEMDSNS